MSGVIISDPYTILEGQKKYYKNLYSSKSVNPNRHVSSSFFDNPTIPKLSDDLKKICEGKVNLPLRGKQLSHSLIRKTKTDLF